MHHFLHEIVKIQLLYNSGSCIRIHEACNVETFKRLAHNQQCNAEGAIRSFTDNCTIVFADDVVDKRGTGLRNTA